MSLSPAATVPTLPLAGRAVGGGGSPVGDILAVTARPEVINFAGGLPARELFDAEGIAEAFRAVLAEQAPRALQYATTEGEPALRGALAGRMTARGLATEADDVLVTTGSQQGLSLVAQALIEPGDTVLVESPCYLAALQVFAFAGARIVPVACDDDGIDPAALEELVVRERPKFLYTVPTFQNPTGRTLSADRRREVARIAARRGLWIVEDDPYGELRFAGERLPWIASLPEAADRTVLLGSFSKVMAPGLRLGWLRAPRQLAAARYLADNDLDAHVARVAAVYGTRRDALLAGLPDALPAGSTWTTPQGGMFVWARLPEGHDTAALLRTVVGFDVAYVPGAPFFAGRPDHGTLRLCFVTQTPDEIAEGLRRLEKGFAAAAG